MPPIPKPPNRPPGRSGSAQPGAPGAGGKAAPPSAPAPPGQQRAGDAPAVTDEPLAPGADVDVESPPQWSESPNGVPMSQWVPDRPIDSADYVPDAQTQPLAYGPMPPEMRQMHDELAQRRREGSPLLLSFDEAKHPRAMKGTTIGGEFISKVAAELAALATPSTHGEGVRPSSLFDGPVELSSLRSYADEAFSVIDGVHSLKLPKDRGKVKVRTGALQGAYGVYDYTDRRLRIDKGRIHPLHTTGTLLHEIGHALDRDSMPAGAKGHYRSTKPEHQTKAWKALMQALYDSPEIQKLRAVRHDPKAGGSFRKHAAYLTNRSEEFARAYEQYIAIKSGNKKLLESVAKRTKGTMPSQWTAESFAPIYKAMEALFEEMGWLIPTPTST